MWLIIVGSVELGLCGDDVPLAHYCSPFWEFLGSELSCIEPTLKAYHVELVKSVVSNSIPLA